MKGCLLCLCHLDQRYLLSSTYRLTVSEKRWVAGHQATVTKLGRFPSGRTPAGRWGQPAELAGTAVFLASSASDFVNGQVIYVDGGMLSVL